MTPLQQAILTLTPTIVDLIKSAFSRQNPNLPPPTSEEVIAAYEKLFADSIAKDEMIKAS